MTPFASAVACCCYAVIREGCDQSYDVLNNVSNNVDGD